MAHLQLCSVSVCKVILPHHGRRCPHWNTHNTQVCASPPHGIQSEALFLLLHQQHSAQHPALLILSQNNPQTCLFTLTSSLPPATGLGPGLSHLQYPPPKGLLCALELQRRLQTCQMMALFTAFQWLLLPRNRFPLPEAG